MQANEGEGNRDCVIFRPNWRPSPPPDSSCFDGGARMPLVIPRVGTTPTREADGRTDATDARPMKTDPTLLQFSSLLSRVGPSNEVRTNLDGCSRLAYLCPAGLWVFNIHAPIQMTKYESS